MNRLYLIDGHALVFKMYYAFLGHAMINSKGEDTSVLFGFTKYLLELIDREQPSHIAVSFDPPGGTFRNQLYSDYKANRPPTPELVIEALEPLTRIVNALQIPVIMLPGFEADDVIGSVAKQLASDDTSIYMVTPDKDYGQLIQPNILQYRPGKSGSDNELIGPDELCAKWDISSPEQVVDVLAICGDSSDNVPGVHGVGHKGAAKLLKTYNSVEGIYEHLYELTARQQELFKAAQDHIALSKQLVTIKTDIAIPYKLEDMRLGISYTPELNAIFDEIEMPSLKRLARKIAESSQQPVEELNLEKPKLESTQLSPEQFKANSKAKRISLYLDGERLYIADEQQYSVGSIEDFTELLQDSSIIKISAQAKPIYNALSAKGLQFSGYQQDIELIHYLIDPEHSHKLESLASQYLGVDIAEPIATQTSLFDEDLEQDDIDRLEQLLVLMPLADKLLSLMSAELKALYDKIEEPLIAVLAAMETTGVKIDHNSLKEFADELRLSVAEQERIVRDIAGDPLLNVASPKQVGALIFEKLALDPKARKPKSGNWPTDEATLQELADRSPVIEAVLRFRGERKLLSTYIEPLPSYISPRDGRVHTTFNQALTSTGRLSSSNPNLQNIPIRDEQSRILRRAFVAGSPDCVMMSADYSQIELRIMAELCGDEHLIDAFKQGIDVHSATAAKIFGVALEDVSSEQRRVAKTANFGIMYGISAFGLSQRLHCSRTEAKQLIDDYFNSFPSIRRFIDQTIASARNQGYVSTIYGRRRYITDINSSNANLRAFAERNAVNAPIQGSAADIIKLAMVQVDKRLREEQLLSRMVLQIHDELLLEVPEEEIDRIKALLVDTMENVISLSIPLTVECSYGKTWLDAH